MGSCSVPKEPPYTAVPALDPDKASWPASTLFLIMAISSESEPSALMKEALCFAWSPPVKKIPVIRFNVL